MQKMLSSVLATALFAGGMTIAAAQNVGGGQTITPQTAPNPDDPAGVSFIESDAIEVNVVKRQGADKKDADKENSTGREK